MVTYVYECQNEDCQFAFEIEQSIKDTHRYKKCQACGKFRLERVMYPPTFFVKREPTTIGQLAERDNKKLGKEGVAAKTRKIKAESEQRRRAKIKSIEDKLPSGAKVIEAKDHKPWYGKLSEKMQKNVQQGNNEKIHKYIMTGEE